MYDSVGCCSFVLLAFFTDLDLGSPISPHLVAQKRGSRFASEASGETD